MKKQILFFIFILASVTVKAYDAKIDGIYYNFDQEIKTATVTYLYNDETSYTGNANKAAYSGNVVIPNEVTHNGTIFQVTSIGKNAFWNCNLLTSVKIPNSVTSIGTRAFSSTSLNSVIIPNSVTTIDGNAFSFCHVLKTITISNAVTSISTGCFYDCSNLTSIILPNSLTSIKEYAFCNCKNLTSIYFSQNINSIDNSAFNNCSTLSNVNVTVIDYSAFCNNKVVGILADLFNKPIHLTNENGLEITEYNIPNDVTSIGNSTFRKCIGLNSIYIPNSIYSIDDKAFEGCSGLTSVKIPNSITSIGSYAFASCTKLLSLIIGTGVTAIGQYAFDRTYMKKTIWLTNTLPSGYSTALGDINYVSNDQFNISNKVVYKFLSSYFEVDGIRYVPVSPSDRTCDAIDCTYDTSVENINIGETVTNKKVTLTVKKVNPYTCYDNKHIKDVKLGLIGEIGDYAFYGCDNLESVELGQNIPSIGSSAFSGCSKLKSIVIPDAVNSLGAYAFSNCAVMGSAIIGDGIETINQYTFSGCSSITEINIGLKVKSINKYAFSGCSSLPKITIPKAVTMIGNSAFNNCTNLAKIIIADSENTLSFGSNKKGSYDYGNPLFSSCPIDSLYIGRDISYNTNSSYGYSPFYRNTSLRAVKITNKETEISENEFYGCTNLQKVIIGDGVTTIGNWAFSGCQSLKYFAFGTQVANIGQNAFSDCTALIEISSKAITPPECGSQALDDINKWECKLYVPDGCFDAYQNAEQWKEFFYTEEGLGTIVIDDEQVVLLGDANNDGEVDKYDINAIVNHIMTGDNNSINFKNADMNEDGKVNVADIIVLNILIGGIGN